MYTYERKDVQGPADIGALASSFWYTVLDSSTSVIFQLAFRIAQQHIYVFFHIVHRRSVFAHYGYSIGLASIDRQRTCPRPNAVTRGYSKHPKRSQISIDSLTM